jgi:RNA polymerase sigma-70 factor, ECF subfamily
MKSDMKEGTEETRLNDGVTLPVATDAEQPFAACYARLYDKFKRFAWAELRDADIAEEAVQSTLVAIWQRHLIRAGTRYVELDPLAFRMLKLRIGKLDRDRRVPAKEPTPLSRWAARAKRAVSPAVKRAAPSVKPGEPRLEDVVDAALAEMTPRCREVFLLRRESELSFKEIAVLCDTGPRSVSALMHRAQFVLREHVDRAGFGMADRRTAADSGRWKIADFAREPDLYESQEAIIERDGNPDSALISDYIAGELSLKRRKEVARRLEEEPAFREIAEPLLMAWSVSPRSKPVPPQDLLRSWHQARARAELPAVAD